MRFRCHHPIPGAKRFLRPGHGRVVVLGARRPAAPSLDLNFLAGPAFARASVGSYFDSLGVLQSAAINVPRYNFGSPPNGVINWIRNSTMVGAIAGTPGTAPTNWTVTNTAGTSITLVGVGTENGIPYAEYRFFGTASGAGIVGPAFETTSGVLAATGQTWISSVYCRLTAGTLTNVTSIALGIEEWNSTPAFITSGNGTVATPTSAGLDTQRSSFTRILAGGVTTAAVRPWLRVNVAAAGAIDITIRIGAPQLERATVANTFVPTSTVAVNGTGVGVLMAEAAATNSVRNNTMVGAIAGTPGTLPTNWGVSQNSGIVPNVIGSGTESGIPYLDIQLSGTVVGATQNNIIFDSGVIAASPNQPWAFSTYLRMMAGSIPAGMTVHLTSGDNIAFQNGINIPTIFSSPLATQLQIFTFTTNAGAVTSIIGKGLQFTAPIGTVVSFTLRIGAPQIEQGSSATSPILTSGTALTRAIETGVPIDPRITFTRASGGNYFDQTGTLQTAATNFPRIDFGPAPTGVNYIRNSTLPGAVAGTPGTLPTDFANISGVAGLSRQIVGTGTSGGLNYVDVRYFGTTDTSGQFSLDCEAAGVIAATTGQTWTSSIYIALVGGSLTNFPIIQRICQRNGAGSLITQTNSTPVPALSATLTRYTMTQLFTVDPGTVSVTTGVFCNTSTGVAVDCTLRIAAPQLEPRANASVFVPTTGAAFITPPTPLGLLIEEARTNSIRNPRAEGAVAGTPGTAPTNWAISPIAGLTSTIVGSGLENGVPYLDVTWAGTTAATQGQIQFETTTATVAANLQAWTHSIYIRLVGGTLANVTSIQMTVTERAAGGTLIADLNALTVTPTGAALNTQRFATTATMNDATTAFVSPRIFFNTSSGVAVNFTLRIGAPQLELGSFATSLILPAVSTPAATTRAIDLATMTPIPGFVQSASGAIAAEYMSITAGTTAASQYAMDVSGGSTINRYALQSNSGGGVARALTSSAGAPTFGGTLFTALAGVSAKTAIAWTPSGQVSCGNGGTTQTTASAAPVPPLSALTIGATGLVTNPVNGWMRRVRVWPRALPPQELAAATR